MSVGKLTLIYLISFTIFLVVDFIWLGFIAKNLYAKYIGHLMTQNVNFIAAFVFYALFIVGVMIFALLPALDKGSWSYALLYGALFGFFTYATYDLTNLATLKDWPILVTIIDLVWGTFLTGSVSVLSYLAVNALFK